ncbi:MAG: lysine--tRNA ligase [Candidatus Paceibacterota bacterium]
MASIEELRSDRLKKKALLEEKGINPYPAESKRTDTIESFSSNFATYESEKKTVTIAGRIMSKRGQGAISFCDIYDGTGRVQAFLKADEMDKAAYELFNDTVDMGDFVEITGTAYITQRGANSIFVSGWTMLAKSLLPIPDAHYGLKDEDERFRKRYLDILINEEVREVVYKRSIFWNTIRQYLLEKSFVEVETPILENTTGGAEARPFVTHHNALDIDVYLRISAGELWQKKLLVAGIPRTFEIGRIFRNEGISNEHLQDYTQLEYYMAYADYNQGMDMTKELYRLIAQKTFGKTTFTIKGFEVDLDAEWKMYDFAKLVQEKSGLDVITETYNGNTVEEKDLIKICKKFDIKYDDGGLNIVRVADMVWKTIRKEIAGPGFLIGVPVSMEPLAKKSRTNPEVVERFQVILAGSEMGKGFSELNDPVDQKERFMHQQSLRDGGDDEAQMADMEFVEALEHGMPPAFGFGLSERLFSFLMDKPVREAQLFPLLKPRND